MSSGLRAVLAAACVSVLAGCTTTTNGAAVKALTAAGETVVALMDTGSYPITAEPPVGAVGSDPGDAEDAEAHRIAQYVVGPWQVDKTMVRPDHLAVAPLSLPTNLGAAMGNVFPDWPEADALGQIGAAHGFIGGFLSGRIGDDPMERSQNGVMRFPDADSAAAAASEMSAVDPPREMTVLSWGFPKETGEVHRLDSAWQAGACDSFLSNPVHPGFAASSTSGGYYLTRTYTSYGPYLMYQLVTSRLSSRGCIATPETIAKQEASLANFVPTDLTKMTELPLDPSGQLWVHALPAAGGTGLWSSGVWSADAWLHFEDDPIKAAARFTSAGVVWVAQRLTKVYQTHNAAGAARIVEQAVADTMASGDAEPTDDGVPGFSAAACFERPAWQPPVDTELGIVKQVYWRFKCIAKTDRYAFVSVSDEEKDAKQQISAQYRILAGE